MRALLFFMSVVLIAQAQVRGTDYNVYWARGGSNMQTLIAYGWICIPGWTLPPILEVSFPRDGKERRRKESGVREG
jgi:hypothetical protein